MNAARRQFLFALALLHGCATAIDIGFAFGLDDVSGLREAMAVTTDSSGNVFVAGQFQGTVDFDPSATIVNLTASGSGNYRNGFVAKYSSTGGLIWAKAFSGQRQLIYAISVDSLGAVYTAGYFENTCDFDPADTHFTLPTSGAYHAFVCKHNSDGTFSWATVIADNGAIGTSIVTGLKSSGSDIVLSGNFNHTADLDPGAGTYNLPPGGGGASQSGFVCKLTNAGAFVWARCFHGTGDSSVAGIDIDGNGDVYAAGSYFGTVDFDDSAANAIFTAGGNADGYLVKLLDATGAFTFVKTFGGATATGNSVSTSGVAVLSTNNIVVGGAFAGTVDFDPGAGNVSLTSPTGRNTSFNSILDSGGTLIRVSTIGAGSVNSLGIATDSLDNIYNFGSFTGTADFDPGPSTFSLSSSSNLKSIVIQKLDSTGNFVWAFTVGGSGDFGIRSMVVSQSGSLALCGDFSGNANVDPINPTATLLNRSTALFIASYRQTAVADMNGASSGIHAQSVFRQFRGAVSIAPSAIIYHDQQNVTSIQSATVRIANPLNGLNENLSVDTSLTGVSAAYNSSTHTLSLSGSAALAVYTQLLRTVLYNNTAPDFNTTPRTLEVRLNDGVLVGPAGVCTMTIVPNSAPNLSLVASPMRVGVGTSVALFVVGNDSEGDAFGISWDFGDGSSSSLESPSHVYTVPGIYTVNATATDSFGAISTGTVVVYVGRAPTPRFVTSDVVGFVGVPLAFDAIYSSDPENAILSYQWNFGDGSPIGVGQSISRVYAAPGSYAVTLTVIDGEGISASSFRSIEILPADQQGLFNSVVTYKVRWDRNKQNADSFNVDATVNVGDAPVTGGTNVAVEIAGQRFEAALDTKLKAKAPTQSFTITAGTRKQAAGEVRIRLTAKKASLGAGFNSSGVVAANDPSDFVEASVPVRLEIAGRVFEVLLDSEFKFSKDGRKASGSGDGP